MEGIWDFLKKQQRWIAASLLLVSIGVAVWFFYMQNPPEPGVLLAKAWEKSMAEDSYSFKSTTKLLVDGNNRVISDIEGQIQQDGFHIKGKIINTPVEVYRIGKVVYLKDIFEGQDWQVFENGLLERQSLVMAELDPLGYLQFNNVLEVKLVGQEQFGERTVYRIETQPEVNNQFLKGFYDNFQAVFLIGKWDHRIWKVVLEGVGKQEQKDKITIEVVVQDYDYEGKLQPPNVKLTK